MPKIVDHEAYRKRLLAQCFALFAHHGYEVLTMRQIAEELGVSTGTLYHYFPTKEALFQQLVEDRIQQAINEVTAEVRPQASLQERLLALCQFIARCEEGFWHHFLIMIDYYQHRERYGEAAGKILRDEGERYYQTVSALLGFPDPRLSSLFHCQINGLLMARMLHGSSTPFMQQAQLFIDLLIEHLQQHGYDGEEPAISATATYGEDKEAKNTISTK
jgi:AcrR family transcriptional regulator